MPVPNYIPHYLVNDYQQWEGEWELWQGIAVAMTPSPFGNHQRIVGRCYTAIVNSLDEAHCTGCEAFIELDWIVKNDTVVRPDLMILCGDVAETFATTTPRLVVEVLSKSTRSRDLTIKFDLYQRQEVPFYLVIDPDSSECKMWELKNQRYRPRALSGPIQITSDCQIQLNLDGLFR